MATIDKLLERIGGVLLVFAGIAIMVMMLHITADVLSKVLLNAPIIVDGRNIYDPARMAREGFAYYGIGIGESIRTRASLPA